MAGRDAAAPRLPYIDHLLGGLGRGNSVLERSFGEHIHWGYWPDPAAARPDSVEDFKDAANRLSLELLDLAAITPGMRVLDAGCGFGGTLACLEERLPGLDLVGLNIDPRQLRRAAGLAAARPGRPPAFVTADACALPFADASFDRVLAVECIFHFPSRAAFLAEVRRVLKPGGVLVLSDFVPAAIWLGPAWMLRWRAIERLNLFGSCDVTCSAAGYRRLAERSGLRMTTMRDISRHTLPTYAFLRHLLDQRKVRDRGHRVAQAGLGLMDFVGRHGLLRYSLARFDRS